MATPNNMPTKRTVKSVRMTMAARHARCADGPNCKGPGCTISTGKTVTKHAQRDMDRLS